ncbi:MAG: phosphoribosyltransferase family protein, partial [Dehalococcoidales bacterium]|nr:phosphoribosyltransferase family protein [Dehalococcoidales bacterium]
MPLAMKMPDGARVLVSREMVASAVMRLASEIANDYRDRNPLLIGILKGSFVFMADLVRHLDFPLEVDFIRLASYGSGTESSGHVRVIHGLKTRVRGRHVLIVEDIIDAGYTVAFLTEYLRKKKPASLR